MDVATARARLERATQADQAPVLSAAEVDDLLAMAATNGTYDDAGLRRATAEGWRRKAQKAKFDVKAGSTEAKRSQMFDMALRMAAQYDGAAVVSGLGSLDLGYAARGVASDEFAARDWFG